MQWHDGEGVRVTEEKLFEEIDKHVSAQGKVFIGTDSQLKATTCTFASAICLHGAKNQKGGRYFFSKKKSDKKSFHVLKWRIMKEVENSINIGLKILEKNPDVDIEIHLDIGTTARSKTRNLVEMMKGWTSSMGFKCKVKPHAWASASVADKHTK